MTPISNDPRRAATRFFWSWLAVGTAASVAGNVAHAVLNPAATYPGVAAALAVVPPVALLGATHGVHALVRSRIVGWAYRGALAITVAVAAAAFVLSFAALRDLAMQYGGVAQPIAWLVPVVIDLSITGSTIALLALSGAERDEVVQLDAPHAVHVEVHNQVSAVAQVEQPAHDSARGVSVADLIAREAAVDEALAAQLPAAEEMLAQGVVRIDRMKVAEVLAESAAGTAPSMIARKVSVGYNTVTRILEHHTEHGAPVGAL